MANKKISELTAASSVATSDVLPIVQGGVTKQATVTQVLANATSTAVVAHGNTGATETFDASAGDLHTATLDANCAITLTGGTAGVSASMTLELTQDGTGSRLATWATSVKWPSRVAPTLTTAAGGVDLITFLWDGTAWSGLVSGQNMLALSAPAAPTGVAGVAGDTLVTVSWTAPADNGGAAITGYVVTPYIAGVAQATQTFGNVLSAAVTGLTNGTAYTFKVAAINSVGTGTQSTASGAVTPVSGGFSDNFNRADGALGNSWGVSGNIQIVSNEAKVVTYSGGTVFALHETNLHDGTFTYVCDGVTSGKEIDLYVRSASTADANNLLQILLAGGNIYVQRVIAGVSTTETTTTYTNPVGAFTAVVTLSGASITVVIAGTTIINAFTLSGAAQTALASNTKAGFGGAVLNGAAGVMCDSFTAAP